MASHRSIFTPFLSYILSEKQQATVPQFLFFFIREDTENVIILRLVGAMVPLMDKMSGIFEKKKRF